jgi:C-terminal peptidase prc
MRLVWSILFAWLAVTALLASVPPADPPVSPAIREEARQYAEFMSRFLGEVHRQYVRRVEPVDLIEAAVQGLYEAARQPLPDNLREEIRRQDRETFLAQVRARLGDNDAVRGTRSIMASINALNRVLDPYCGFAGPREFRTLFDNDSYGTGIEFENAPLPNNTIAPEIPQRPGVVLTMPRGTTWSGLPDVLQVKTVIPGSPAQRAGLRPGDLVAKIDGKPCSATDASRYFRGFYPNAPDTMPGTPAAKPLTLEVRRPGGATNTVMLEAYDFAPESVFGARRKLDYSWDFMMDHAAKLGYIRVGPIALLTANDFREAVGSLKEAGARGLVLDLRWCPGGYLDMAIMIASTLLPPHAPVARVVYRDPNVRQEQPTPETTPILDLPIVVLINGETSGGGELIAGALQDHGRAIIAGERTVGKASVQRSLDRNPMGLTYKLTIGTFHRPSDKNLQRFAHSTAADDWGIQPDQGKWLPLSADAARQLKEQWNNHVLRPAGSNEALPTDDPDTDPQLKAALGILRQKLK